MAECLVNLVPAGRPGAFSGQQCGDPATVTVEYGCIHEHIREEQVCPGHAGRFTGVTDLACTDCWSLGHYCRVTGRVKVTS